MILILVVLVISTYFDLIMVDLDHYLILPTSPDLDPESQPILTDPDLDQSYSMILISMILIDI